MGTYLKSARRVDMFKKKMIIVIYVQFWTNISAILEQKNLPFR